MLLKGNPFQKCKVMTISCHEIIFYILVSTTSFYFHSYFGRPLHLILLVSTVVEKLVEFYVFFFLLLKVWISRYIFFHFELIIVLNVRSLVNDKFSNLILNVFVIIGFISSNKKVKQIALINHRWISLNFTKGMGVEVLVILQNMGVRRVIFLLKKRDL